METGVLSPGDADGAAMDQAAHMEELSRMLGEPSGQVSDRADGRRASAWVEILS